MLSLLCGIGWAGCISLPTSSRSTSSSRLVGAKSCGSCCCVAAAGCGHNFRSETWKTGWMRASMEDCLYGWSFTKTQEPTSNCLSVRCWSAWLFIRVCAFCRLVLRMWMSWSRAFAQVFRSRIVVEALI